MEATEGALLQATRGGSSVEDQEERLPTELLGVGSVASFLQEGLERGFLDEAVALWVKQKDPVGGPLSYLALWLAERCLRMGSTFLSWEGLEEGPCPGGIEEADSSVVFWRGFHEAASRLLLGGWRDWAHRCPHLGSGESLAPWVISDKGVGLFRFWSLESQILGDLKRSLLPGKPSLGGIPEREARDEGFRSFWDYFSCRRITLLTGGPGSGKSTLLGKTVAAYAQAFPEAVHGIQLAAPTARAARRLSGLIPSSGLSEAALHAIPEPVTVHRLLGQTMPRVARPPAGDPELLPIQLLIVDEASMLSSAALLQLLVRLPSRSRVILAGDGSQLPSIEPGGLLQALCRVRSKEVARQLPLWHLTHSRRFKLDSGLGRTITAVLKGDQEGSWRSMEKGGVDWLGEEPTGVDLERGYRAYWKALESEPLSFEALWEAYASFRILTFGYGGRRGADVINQSLEEKLHGINRARGRETGWGLPLMITKNLPALGLANGDVGLVWPSESASQGWVFRQGEGASGKLVPLSHLPSGVLSRAFASTVHKAQGSEFEAVLLILPERSAGMKRAWLYTGLTRARSRVAVAGAREVWNAMVREEKEIYESFFDVLLEKGLDPLEAAVYT